MDFYSSKKPVSGYRYGIGFKSKTQLPFVMVWKEYWHDGEVYDATVIYSSSWGKRP